MHRPRVFEHDEEEEHRRREYDLKVWYRYEPPGIHSLEAFRFSREEMCEFAILLIKAYIHSFFANFISGVYIYIYMSLYIDIVLDRIILYIFSCNHIFIAKSYKM